MAWYLAQNPEALTAFKNFSQRAAEIARRDAPRKPNEGGAELLWLPRQPIGKYLAQ